MFKRFLLTITVLGLTLSVVFASAALFKRLVQEFHDETIKEFVQFVVAGERYPLMHAIYNLRFRVFSEKLLVKQRSETKDCSYRRSFGTPVPESQQKFCKKYDELVDLAKEQIAIVRNFEIIYMSLEPVLLREIERQKARDAVRLWIRQKINCLTNKYSCGRNERNLLDRLTHFNADILGTYAQTLANLERKLFPDAQQRRGQQSAVAVSVCNPSRKNTYGKKFHGMVLIHGGTFTMGNNNGAANEKPAHQVKVDDFLLDRCEVTNSAYLDQVSFVPFLRKSTFPRQFHDGNYLRLWNDDLEPPFNQDKKPVVYVSWFAARHYCQSLGKRLPSEAEWEWAAGSGSTEDYSFGNDPQLLSDYAWYDKNALGMLHLAGSLQANERSLYDMYGNVAEWVYDHYTPYDSSLSLRDNPQGPIKGKYRVIRGGSRENAAPFLRSTARRDDSPTSSRPDVGFRCAAKVPAANP